MSDTTSIIYSGPHEGGLFLSEGLGYGYVEIPFGVPFDCPTDVAKALIAERPDEFAKAAAKKAPAKKAAARKAAADPAPAADDTPTEES